MTSIASIGTYLPSWGTASERTLGADEDALTLAVAAGRAALLDDPPVERVVLVTRDFPLLEGGNAAALLAGLDLGTELEVVERVGGAPATLDALLSARARTLVIGADTEPAGAAAAAVSDTGLELATTSRVARSLPVLARTTTGSTHVYEDPRLLRTRGLGVSVQQTVTDGKPVAVAGLSPKQAAAISEGAPPALPTTGASAALFAVAAANEASLTGLMLAADQATVTTARINGGTAGVTREEPTARSVPETSVTPGPEIPISLPAYERAFEPKLRWEAGQCAQCNTLAFPPRQRCVECGAESGHALVPLPRNGEVYTTTTVEVPVPNLSVPYSLAIVELDGCKVRALVKVTGTEPGRVSIGDRGRMVLRRVAVRSGVPDYGYAFEPEEER